MKIELFNAEPNEMKKERRGIQSVEVGGQLLVALVDALGPCRSGLDRHRPWRRGRHRSHAAQPAGLTPWTGIKESLTKNIKPLKSLQKRTTREKL